MNIATMNSSQNISAIDELSLEILRFQIPALICWVMIGLLAILGNALIILTIVKSKKLHNECMWIFVSLATGDFLCGLVFSLQGFRKLYLISNGLPETSPQYVCLFWGGPSGWSASISDAMTLALNIDRWIAITFPIYYKVKLNKKYLISLNSIAWIGPTIFWAACFRMENPGKLMPVCFATTSADKWFQNFYSYARWVLIASNLIFFSMTLMIICKRLIKSRSLPANERREARESMEIGIIKALAFVLALYITLKLASYAVTIYSYTLSDIMKLKVGGAYAGIPAIGYSASQLFAYMATWSQFRKGFCAVVLRRNGAVVGPNE